MPENLVIGKATLIIITRCNLRCKLCCEYVPQNKPFPDMTVDECETILSRLFKTVDYVDTLHLSGGGEPFLHPQLAELVENCMRYTKQFGRLMLFTNSTVIPSKPLLEVLRKYRDKLVIQVSCYGINPSREVEVIDKLKATSVALKVEKYYGEDQSFGGWVDFGPWKAIGRSKEELSTVFHDCAVTRDMCGNWRTRDGKFHWCSRSQRGMDLGFLPDNPEDYVDLLDDNTTREDKRKKFASIMSKKYLTACNYCSGNQGTVNSALRFPAAEQM